MDVRRLRVAVLPLLYLVLALLLVSPPLGDLGDRVVGDNGDSLFNLWVVDWVWHNATSWGDLWRGQMFQPNPLTLAYSDFLLPQAIVAGIVRTLGGSSVLAFNVVALLGWTASLVVCDRLFRRFTTAPLVAIVGSVAWNFSTIRLGHLWHFQLVTAGVFVPLALLCALRFLDEPSPRRGAVLGLVSALTALAASYYGLMIAVAVTFVVVARSLVDRKTLEWRRVVLGAAAAVGVAAVLLLPVWVQYQRLRQDGHFRRVPDAASIVDWRDFMTPASISQSLRDAPVLRSFTPTDVEHQLFVGVVVALLAVAGLVVLVLRRDVVRRRDVGVLVALGVAMLLLSAGDRGWLVGVDAPGPFRLARALVPPFNSIRAPSRFAILFQLALVLLAVVALDRLLARSRRLFAVVAVIVVAGLLVEARVSVPLVRPPAAPAEVAVNRALDRLPRGLTVELPVVAPSRGAAWPFVEAPRQYLARLDGQPRVNGYSGFDSPGLEEVAATLNTFPSSASLRMLRQLDVAYVVVRDGPVGDLDPATLAAVLTQVPPLDRAAIDAAIASRPDWLISARRAGEASLLRLS